ncbi:MAG: hypothetical protein O2909_12185 [Chloroflexi bacterium]|nr:hypothetical protein [Chloroflexota bacterium]
MNRMWMGLSSLGILTVCVAVIPLAVQFGLLILATNPNPRHPPSDLMGEAMGWAIIGALSGAVCAVIGESVSLQREGGFLLKNRALIIGSVLGIVIAGFLGPNFAVLQMDSVDGQAITSVSLGIISGAVVAILGAVSGVIIGVTLRRSIVALMS